MALAGLRVLDLSRILAGPSATQLLGDLGADVVKIEKPGEGDDTRKWGPPFVPDQEGRPSSESAYYLCANRNKRSIEIDITTAEGQALIHALLAKADVFIENYKVGGLQAYGLAYAQIKSLYPKLVYCSITGFGQTGPYANRAGYDFLIQAMGGIMSVTGAPDGDPMKVGVGIADVMTGMYATVGILAALRHRDQTGEGQYIDLALLDTQVSWLINAGTSYLTSRKNPQRLGNGHPNIVPYQVFPTADFPIIIAVGNDNQFRKFCEYSAMIGVADDPDYATNVARVKNRDRLIEKISEALRQQTRDHWVSVFEKVGVPCGPVNTLEQVFADPQIRHRQAEVALDHPIAQSGKVSVIANPLKLSATPVQYRFAPPVRNQHEKEILHDWLGRHSK
ncbi:MAG: CaiB/BaiF CoA transferase family protein [Burkholderiaceae bacterium]|jgi:crotonobetainyl-CoA:carnitine CoA-transferase CaiB-like acyl-CoA transferase